MDKEYPDFAKNSSNIKPISCSGGGSILPPVVLHYLKIQGHILWADFCWLCGGFNQISGALNIFIVVPLWSESHSVEGT